MQSKNYFREYLTNKLTEYAFIQNSLLCTKLLKYMCVGTSRLEVFCIKIICVVNPNFLFIFTTFPCKFKLGIFPLHYTEPLPRVARS